MTKVTANKARSKRHRLMNFAAQSHEPVVVSGKRNRAVLVSEDGWRATQETLFLLSVPGMRESIQEGMEASVEDCSEVLEW